MIDPIEFINYLESKDIKSFYGIPDSLLKSFCNELINKPLEKHQISTNEAMSVASAIGNYLATGELSCIYMQNSGLGNSINPIVSLASRDVYSIPLLIVIGWRGEILNDFSQIKDEPQHIQQGRITCKQLELIDIPFKILSKDSDDWKSDINYMLDHALEESRPVALVCRKGTFNNSKVYSNDIPKKNVKDALYTREEIIQSVVDKLPSGIPIFSTTGMASRELYEIRKSKNTLPIDFYTVGGMGCASSIALGFIRASKMKQVVCIDGDGSVLMHLGSMLKISKQPGFIHIIINNNAHDSVGGQETCADEIDFIKLGESFGYGLTYSISKIDEVENVLNEVHKNHKLSALIEIKVKKGNRSNLGRPKESPTLNKQIFMEKWSKQ